jgi:SAM-dependent methyltransferase
MALTTRRWVSSPRAIASVIVRCDGTSPKICRTPRVFGVEAIDDEDASYDVVLCREGLMFAVDPELAAREIARVLRPGGRTALAVWGPREHNPWLGCVFDVVGAQFERPMPPPGNSTPRCRKMKLVESVLASINPAYRMAPAPLCTEVR